MRQWFCHVCPGVDRRTLFHDLAESGVPDWFVTDGYWTRSKSIGKAGKYRGLVIAMSTSGVCGTHYREQIGVYVHRLAAGFQSVGRPIVVLLCGAGDQGIADGLSKAGVLPSGKAVIGWLGENVGSGIRALALTSSYQAGLDRSLGLLPDYSGQNGAVINQPAQNTIIGCQSVLRAFENLIEAARPSWQPSGIFITGDPVQGDIPQKRLVHLYRELEQFAGAVTPYAPPGLDGHARKCLFATVAVVALLAGGAIAWQDGAFLRDALSPHSELDDVSRLWALGESFQKTQAGDLIGMVPGTPVDALRKEVRNLTETALKQPTRKSFELRLDALEQTALTADAKTIVSRSVRLLSELALYLKGPIRPSEMVGQAVQSTSAVAAADQDIDAAPDPWWGDTGGEWCH